MTDAVSTGIPALVPDGVSSQEQAGGGEEDLQPAQGGAGVKGEDVVKKAEDEEDKYQKIPEYVKMLKIKESIRKKAGMVELLEREVGQMAGVKEMWMKEAKEDREAWSGFKASCVNLAEQWLEMKKTGKEVDMLRP